MPQQFASDNNAGICPVALAALVEANGAGHVPGYGGDAWTERAVALLQDLFETKAQVFFAANGTAANGLALAQILRPYDAVIAHAQAHIEEDEAGAVGFFSGGAKIVLAGGTDGKLGPGAVAELAGRGRGVHHVRARALSLTQATELGTVYTAAEIASLSAAARAAGLKVHMDGARFANAVASLGVAPAELSWRAGVDVLVFGGVKNGLGFGEAILFFDDGLADAFAWRVKQSGHLASKMRLIAAPWAALIESGAWLGNARHANAMARRLGLGLEDAGAGLLQPVQANAVFAELPVSVQAHLRTRGWRFYTFMGETACRLMCAWDTQADTVDRFIADAAGALRPA